MNKKLTCSILLASFLGFPSIAQHKMLTMEDAVLGLRGGALMPDNLKQAQWKNKTVHYTKVAGSGNAAALIQNTPVGKQTDTLLYLSQLNLLLFQKDSLKSFPAYQWNPHDQLVVAYRTSRYILEQQAKQQWKVTQQYVLPAN